MRRPIITAFITLLMLVAAGSTAREPTTRPKPAATRDGITVCPKNHSMALILGVTEARQPRPRSRPQ
jgi:hypothetical protein